MAHVYHRLQSCTTLTELPESIGTLTSLQVLYAHGCSLARLPATLVQCTKLKVLTLSKNRLEAVPSWIGYLVKLEVLWLDRNAIKYLPPEVGALRSLKQLKLAGNVGLNLPPGCLPQDSGSGVGVGAGRSGAAGVGAMTNAVRQRQLRAVPAEVVVHQLFGLLFWTPGKHALFYGAAGATMPLTAILLSARRASAAPEVPAALDGEQQPGRAPNVCLPTLPPEIWWEIFKFFTGADFTRANQAKALEEAFDNPSTT